jgi:HK97 gp10 family phage protein
MDISYKLKGLNKALKDIDKFSKRKQNQIADELAGAGLDIETRAKHLCPEDTRFLRNHIIRKPEKWSVIVGSSVNYAPYVEFGTGGLVDISGWEDFAAQFKGKGKRQVNRRAQPFLRPAFDESKNKLIKELNRIIKSK